MSCKKKTRYSHKILWLMPVRNVFCPPFFLFLRRINEGTCGRGGETHLPLQGNREKPNRK